ncbi:MAG: acyl carrier protein [Candidatus Altiarchaeota archaeon]
MKKVKEIIASVFEIDIAGINMEMTSDDIEKWDSLGQLKLINALEKEFNVIFEMEEIFSIMSIKDVYRILEQKKAIKSGNEI